MKLVSTSTTRVMGKYGEQNPSLKIRYLRLLVEVNALFFQRAIAREQPAP